jgi:hypothetical protein
MEYEFNVRPRPGTEERSLDVSREPARLPEYDDPTDTVVYTLTNDLRDATQSLYDGLGMSVFRGAVVGVLGGLFLPLAPAWYFFETAPGIAGVALGIPSVVGGASSAVELMAIEPTPFERIAYSVNFASEIRLNVNRVIQCAGENGVGLQHRIKSGIGQNVDVVAGGPSAGERIAGVQFTQVWYEDQGNLP